MDDEWLRIVNFSLNIDIDNVTTTTDDIVEAMKKHQEWRKHIRKQRNVILDRREFYTRSQERGESFNDFLIAVKEIYQFCEFCTECENEQIRDKSSLLESVTAPRSRNCSRQNL